ncbi:hypothetical protein JCM8547_006009 [Rhodosporidiobolus lusitaniae]
MAVPPPSRTSTPSTAPFSPPLRLSPSPSSSSVAQFASTSTSTAYSTTSRPPSPSIATTSVIRNRTTNTSSDPSPAPSPRPSFSLEPDVTRPTLRRVANDALGAANGAGAGAGLLSAFGADAKEDDYVVRRDRKGKGKASIEGRRAVSESQAGGTGEGKDREVIVHKLAKTDTIASVALQYGITPQNLRTSNRLWASDSIHLRAQLLIPLDLCNLPSSSFGVERIAREENGDLTVWQRNGRSSGGEGGEGRREGLGGAAERAGKQDALLSPKARRLASASAFELGGSSIGSSTPPTGAPASASEFLDVWSSPSSSHASFDTFPHPHPAPLPSPSRFDYLSSTNNTFHAPPSPPTPTDEELVSRTVSPPGLSSSSGATAASFSRPSSSAATSPPPGSDPSPSSSSAAHKPLEKRTLRIERMTPSQLSFFPPSSSTPSSEHPPKSSSNSSSSKRQEDESLFFGPLTNSLSTSFSALGLDKYLPTSLSSTSSSSAIRLPPSPLPGGPGAGGGRTVRSKWSLLNFGAEESEAGLGERGSYGLGDYFGGALGGGGGGGKGMPRSVSLGGASSTRETKRTGGTGLAGAVGLTDSGSWSRSSTAKPLPPYPLPPPPGSPGGSPRHPRGSKLRDSNERVYEGLGGGEAGKTRGQVRRLF